MVSYESLLEELHSKIKKLQAIIGGGEKSIVEASNKAGNPLNMLDVASLHCAIAINIHRFTLTQQTTLTNTAHHLSQALSAAEVVRFKAKWS